MPIDQLPSPSPEINAAKERKGKTQFILTGFAQETDFRVFAFEGIGADRVRTKHTVRADLGLIRRYGIKVQDLPLLCRSLLDRHDNDGDAGALTFSEAEMRLYSEDCAAMRTAAAQKRKPSRKPTSENVGAAWRAPQVW
jgi:hypothetical protein